MIKRLDKYIIQVKFSNKIRSKIFKLNFYQHYKKSEIKQKFLQQIFKNIFKMSQNLLHDKKLKYKVVKILGTQTNAAENTLKVIKLVQIKKPTKNKMPEFINLEDNDEQIIKVDDSSDENVSNVAQNVEKQISSEEIVPLSFDDLVQNNTSNRSKLIISSVTSARSQQTSLGKLQIVPKSAPTVISITTHGANITNIHEEIEKVKKCLSENSTNSKWLEISDLPQNSFQIENIQSISSSLESDNEKLLVELNCESKTLQKVQRENISKYCVEDCVKEATKEEISSPKRNRKVPRKFSEGENFNPLLKLSEIHVSTSIPPKSLKRKNVEEETKKPQKKSRKGITIEKPQVEEVFRNTSELDTEANTSILRDLLLQPIQHPKPATSQQSNGNVLTNLTKPSITKANTRKSKRIANQGVMKNKSTDQSESSRTTNFNESSSEDIKLSQADHLYISVKQDVKDLSKFFDLSKIEIRRFALNITKIDHRKYISASEPNSPNLSSDLEHQLGRNSSDPNLAKKSENKDTKIKYISSRLRKRNVKQMEEVPTKSRGSANKRSKKVFPLGDQKSSNDALSSPLNEKSSTFTDHSSTPIENQFLALSKSKFSTPIVEDTSSSKKCENSQNLTPTNDRPFDDSERDVMKLYERLEKQLQLKFANKILEKLKPKVKISYPSKSTTKEDFFNMLNLQTPKSTVIKQEIDLEPQISLQNGQFSPTPPTSAENTASNSKLSAKSLPKQRSPPGSYLMKLKCHKTCFNSKVHNKKHKVDISSPMGQLLTKRDVIDDAYIQDSLKRIDQFTKTPVFDNKTNCFIHSKQNTKNTKTLKGKTGRKSGVSEVLAVMGESGTEKNFMRRGSKVKTFVPLKVYVKQEIC